MNDPIVAEQEFETLVRKHDLTYSMSDDPRYWNAGRMSLNQINVAAAALGQTRAAAIWNKVVDERILYAEDRAQYYWRVP